MQTALLGINAAVVGLLLYGTIRSGMDERDLIALRFWTRNGCLYLASILEVAAMACRYSHSLRWLVARRSSGGVVIGEDGVFAL